MSPEQISLLALAVSLLSALIAAWSLRESKEARSENNKLTVKFRKTELLTSLIDTTNKGYQLLNEIHDCFEKIIEREVKNNEEIQNDIQHLLQKKDDVFEKIKEFDDSKQKFMDTESPDINEIEANLSLSYAQFKAWDNDIILTQKLLKKIECVSPPSAYEERGVLTI